MTWPSSPTTYRPQVVVDRSRFNQGEIRLLTVPPIHAARIDRLPSGRWRADFVSMLRGSVLSYADLESALWDVATMISRAAGRDWREKFTGIQRIALGQQVCPHLIKDLVKLDICRKSPEIGTIWCKDHLSVIRGNHGS